MGRFGHTCQHNPSLTGFVKGPSYTACHVVQSQNSHSHNTGLPQSQNAEDLLSLQDTPSAKRADLPKASCQWVLPLASLSLGASDWLGGWECPTMPRGCPTSCYSSSLSPKSVRKCMFILLIKSPDNGCTRDTNHSGSLCIITGWGERNTVGMRWVSCPPPGLQTRLKVRVVWGSAVSSSSLLQESWMLCPLPQVCAAVLLHKASLPPVQFPLQMSLQIYP